MKKTKAEVDGPNYRIPLQGGGGWYVAKNKMQAGAWKHVRNMSKAGRIGPNNHTVSALNVSPLMQGAVRWVSGVCSCCGQKTDKKRKLHPALKLRLQILRQKYRDHL